MQMQSSFTCPPLFQACMNLFLLLITKEGILKKLTSGSLIHAMEVNGDHQLYSNPDSSKYFLLCLVEERN